MPDDLQSPQSPPVVLSIAGSDCSSGAGVQADLKTFSALGCYGLTALTAVVAEVPGKVECIKLIEAEMVAAQIRTLAGAFPIAAAKTGMLGGRLQIEAVIRAWEPLASRGVPLVVDPVMVSSSGTRLLDEDAMERLVGGLVPLAKLITPNLAEAAVLLESSITNKSEMEAGAKELVRRHKCAVLLKGGHLIGDDVSDVLVDAGEVHWIQGRRIHGVRTHGTGCIYSAAIAAGLAQGLSLLEAVRQAKRCIMGAISGHLRWGGMDALNPVPTHA